MSGQKHSDKLVTDNLGLVHMCVKRFTGRGEEYEDLFQIGCVGLVKAADNFDPDLGNRFSTYAVPMILGEIRSSFRSGGLLQVSRSLRSLSSQVAKATEFMTDKLGRAPSLDELATELDISREKIAEAIAAALPMDSLNAENDEGKESEIPDGLNYIDKLTEKLSLRQSVEMLEEKDRRLIELRYCRAKTQKETAEILGSNQVQISRREKKILLRLRGVLL